MSGSITTEQVWEAIDDAYFGVLAFVNRNGHPRTAGVCYVVDARSLYISTDRDMWKVRHIAANPNVSMTVTMPKRVPFLPFIKVPAATVTFKGEAQILAVGDIPPHVFEQLPKGDETDPAALDQLAIIRIVPRGDFVTYGINMSIMQMRKHEEAHGRAPCGTDQVAI
ncbi:MAG: pyridoxamine 5'-phosphate oxidase family protein [Acidimicrobiia bacterium]|nr:pyridoxamine 5'-phosphate oxidase family protein [Acidimicrobiia bacterium]